MSSEVDITWNGAQIIAELKEFKEDVAVKTVRASTRRIAAALQKQLRADIAQRTGRLMRNIAVRAKYIRSRGVVAAKVIVNTRGKKDNPQNAFYWRFVEFDHKTRPRKHAPTLTYANVSGRGPSWRKRSIDRSGQRTVKGQGVIQDTFNSMQPQIQSMFYADLEKTINRRKARYSAP